MYLFTINLLHCHPISESSKRTSEKKAGEEASVLKIASSPQTKALEKYTRQMEKKQRPDNSHKLHHNEQKRIYMNQSPLVMLNILLCWRTISNVYINDKAIEFETHYSAPDCAHIHCLIYRNVQHSSMKASGCIFPHREIQWHYSAFI